MKYEYSIREVTRYVLTEYRESDLGSGSRVICEFDHKPYAEDICNRLNSHGEVNEFYPHTEMTIVPWDGK